MYYIVYKNKDGVYLLDNIQSVLFKDKNLNNIMTTWKDVKKQYENNWL